MRSSSLLPSLALTALVASACSDSSRPIPVTPEPATLDHVEVRPATAMLTKGSTLALTARAVLSDDTRRDITGQATWASSDVAVATVTSSGGVQTLSPGTVSITATYQEKSGTMSLTVTALPLVRLALTPASAILDQGGETQLTATGTFEDGATADVTAQVTWSASSSIAAVTAGRVRALQAGTVTITARDAATGVEASATITVQLRLPTSLSVTPPGVVLPLGLTQQYTATARYADGSSVDATSLVTWSSTNRAAATVDAGGLATTVAPGLTSITAQFPGGPQASTTLSVGPAAVVDLVLAPVTATIATGQRQPYTAEARYSDGARRDVTFLVTWTSSDPSVVVIGGAAGDRNVARPVGTGTVTISAVDPTSGVSSETLGTSARLRVLPPTLVGIVVTPNVLTIPFGATQQFSATGLYSDNTSRNLSASVQWSSSAPAVGTISATGLLTSVTQGVTRIDAVDPVTGVSSAQTMNGTAVLTIAPPALLSIAVTPAIWTMVVGGTRQFVATGTFSDGSVADISTAVTWASSAPAVVRVGTTGLATAQSVGLAMISARDPATMISSDDDNASARVTASLAALVSIALVPTATTVPAGGEARLRAVGSYDNGATDDLTDQVTWSVVTTSVASIGNAPGIRGQVFRTRPGATGVVAVEPGSGISSGPAARVVVTAAPALAALTIEPRSAVVAVGRTVQLAARGRFADGQVHAMTNTVDWTSSSPANATVGNTDGTRGRVTGVAVGAASIAAVYAVAGISALPAAAITVELGIVTVARTWSGAVVTVDATTTIVGSAVFDAADFGPSPTITDVDVSIEFLKTDGSCAAPGSFEAYHGETSFRLRTPAGTFVTLASAGTWSGNTAISPVTVVFDDAAAGPPSMTPVSGTFRPTVLLSTLNGTSPVGTWALEAGDSAGGDPLCVFAYTVTVTAQ